MPIKIDARFVGRAWITPDTPVVAGAWGTWTFTYEVGVYGYDERARLKIASRFASDWGRPQFTDPRAPNYTTVRLESRCATAVASLAFEPRGQVRPWFKCLVASVADGSLYPGDRLHITLGDTSGGSPGSRAQTFREKGCEWRGFVGPFWPPAHQGPPGPPGGGGRGGRVPPAPARGARAGGGGARGAG